MPRWNLARDRPLWLYRVPDRPTAWRAAKELVCHIDLEEIVYFAARDEIAHSKTGGALVWWWRLPLFVSYSVTRSASDRFNFPVSKTGGANPTWLRDKPRDACGLGRVSRKVMPPTRQVNAFYSRASA